MKLRRRDMLAATIAGSGVPASAQKQDPPRPTGAELDRLAAKPVLLPTGLQNPLIIDSIRLLQKDKEYLVHVRSKDGAEGVAFTNPPRAGYLAPVLKSLIVPYLLGKDARGIEDLLWGLYRYRDNYKMYGLALWSPQAWVEFAILDMLGRAVNKPMGALFGPIVRREVPIYVASARRDTTPEQEIDYLQKLVDESGAKALKFRIGGVMSRNADASPGRTGRLIPLAGKHFGGKIALHADSNSSYDPPLALKYGRMLEEIKAVYYEEPCPFDHLEDTKVVADALTIPVAAGEQEYSDWRFRWVIANRGCDIVQPDLNYYGGMIRSLRVARMAAAARMPTTVHISGGFGFVYMLHFASVVPDIGEYQEYKLGSETYGPWIEGGITVKDGKMTVPTGAGAGIKDMKALLAGAVEV
ncbi:MAG: mandelate racemase/muconate lactonizing enzyme family protein [Bryobacterales bacterium]|nr:mandelate racemase/muconate lactonizing enzyme family protein [Bryobacterales bacterium]